MAQNITLLGASYSDVPAVTLPKTGGGTATFTDVTDTTAAAADVASGKYFYTDAGVRTEGTASGGGGGGSTEPVLKLVDYDGTVLYQYTATQFASLSALPANPTHAGLTAQGWNWTLAEIQAQLTAYPDQCVYAGQNYTTQSGSTEIYITLTAAAKSPYLCFTINGSATVAWGDGTTETITGTGSLTYTQHVYASAGSYCISLTPVGNAVIRLGNPSYATLLMPTNTNPSSEAAMVNTGVYMGAITKVYIGPQTTMWNRALERAYNMTEVTLPASGAYDDGLYALRYCTRLNGVVIPRDFTTLSQRLFHASHFSTISIPPTTTIIRQYVFADCRNLRNISIPSSLATLESYSFNNCYALEEVTIPASVVTIGSYAFKNCYSLKKAALFSGLQTISQQAFSGCYSLRDMTIPGTVKSIQTNAFEYCSSLETVTIPSTLTTFGSSAFRYCYGLRSATYSFKLTSSQSSLFQGCMNLQALSIPATSTIVPGNYFYGCTAIASVTIPNTVTEIGTSAFQGMYQLREVTIPANVTKIGNYFLYQCYSLPSVTIPANVTTIGTYAFADCRGMKEIHVKPTTPPSLGNNSWTTLPADCVIYVPSASLATYKTASNWSTVASQMVGE